MSEVMPAGHRFAGLFEHGYKCILADPPWRFRSWSETNQYKSASKHYDLMMTDDIGALPVPDLAADNCVLFLWVINPMLPQGLEVMRQWGFKFSTLAFNWAKTTKHGKWHLGLGYWTRANSELCLLGTKGKPKRKNDAKSVRQLVISPRREHSRKPDEIVPMIERLVEGPYLELFSRSSRANWTCWGDEVGKFTEHGAPPQNSTVDDFSDNAAVSTIEREILDVDDGGKQEHFSFREAA